LVIKHLKSASILKKIRTTQIVPVSITKAKEVSTSASRLKLDSMMHSIDLSYDHFHE
jgi:hypothetical protein